MLRNVDTKIVAVWIQVDAADVVASGTTWVFGFFAYDVRNAIRHIARVVYFMLVMVVEQHARDVWWGWKVNDDVVGTSNAVRFLDLKTLGFRLGHRYVWTVTKI